MPALTLTQRRPRYGTGQKVAYTDSAGSASLPPETRTVIISCSTDAYVRVGAAATTADLFLPAGVIAQIPVDNITGSPIIVSAIRDTVDGSLYCIAAAE
jgi:hypothetical protein